ncbi:MAG: EAL domain-containing protein [Candidatus Nitrotoga sp.]
MINVKSLNVRIVVQFAVVLLPQIALLIYITYAEANHDKVMIRAFDVHSTAIKAQDKYKQFLNGAADSVDTGSLTKQAHAALISSRVDIDRLIMMQPDQAIENAELSHRMRSIDEAVSINASFKQLLLLQEPINQVRKRIEQLVAEQQKKLDAFIASSNERADTSRMVVMILSALLLIMTIGFVLQLIRGLSRPLNHAVDVADRIASGHKLDSFDVDTQHDVGNLLGSLWRMHNSLLAYENDDEQHRRSLEEKIRELAQSQRQLDQAQAAAKLGSWQWDQDHRVTDWSKGLYQLLGLSNTKHSPTLRLFLHCLPPRERKVFINQLRSVIKHLNEVSIEHHISIPEGEDHIVSHQIAAVRDNKGNLLSLSGVVQDITDRRLAEEKMRRLALFDSLTGLANRQFFNEHLRNAVARSKRNSTIFATIFVDLDRFKRINDTLGHAIGDALLHEAAARLVSCVRDTDEVTTAESGSMDGSMVARLGGDEFIVLLRDLLQPRDAVVVAQRIINGLTTPFTIEGHELVVTASLGIAMYPTDGENVEDLIKAADSAMYVAKSNGRNTFQFYSKEMNSAAYEKLSLETKLRQAIDNGQLVLHYQPKVDIRTGAMFGMEALVRWQHPQWGLVAPSRFIPLAEELGLIVQLGDRVLELSCKQMQLWREAGLGEVCISVNLSSPSFLKPGLASEISELIQKHELHPQQLLIEATESMLIQSGSAAMNNLQALQALGVQLSIDDFGTGYSSLTYLRRFPVNEIKIDQSFVAEMTHNTDDAAIVSAIVSLGHNMNRRIVAEGVETIRQAIALRNQECHLMQGFLFSRPVPADEMANMLSLPYPFAWVAKELGSIEISH